MCRVDGARLRPHNGPRRRSQRMHSLVGACSRRRQRRASARHLPRTRIARRASTSASASAAAAVAATAAVNGSTTQAGVNAFRRVHAPIPVRAAPFGDASASASSSDEEGGDDGAAVGVLRSSLRATLSQRRSMQHSPRLCRRLSASSIRRSWLRLSSTAGRGGGARAVPLGSANTSSGSSGSNASNGSGTNSGYVYSYSNSSSMFGSTATSNNSSVFGSAAPSNNGSAFGPSANHSSNMFGAPGNGNPYVGGAGAFDVVDLESARGRGGGPNAFASAAEALAASLSPVGHTRGRSSTMTDTEGVQGWPARPEMHSRGGSGHASAARSRSALTDDDTRVPILDHAHGGRHAHEQQPPAPQPKEAPARGPTATPVASGWTRKFQKSAPGASAGTPQPQATGPPPAPVVDVLAEELIRVWR